MTEQGKGECRQLNYLNVRPSNDTAKKLKGGKLTLTSADAAESIKALADPGERDVSNLIPIIQTNVVRD